MVAATIGWCATAAGALVGGGAFLAGALTIGYLTIVPATLAFDAFVAAMDRERVIARVRLPDGHVRDVREHDQGGLELGIVAGTSDLELTIAHRTGTAVLHGGAAEQVAGLLLARLNRAGAASRYVNLAVSLIEGHGSANEYVAWASRQHEIRRHSGEVLMDPSIGPFGLTFTERLALEMALNEQSEQRAIRGDLQALEDAWRDAEEIAAISDELLLPDRVIRKLDELRSQR